MGFVDDMKNKASELVEKAKDVVGDDKVEEYSDQAIQTAGGKADEMTGGKYTDKIDAAEQAADDQI